MFFKTSDVDVEVVVRKFLMPVIESVFGSWTSNCAEDPNRKAYERFFTNDRSLILPPKYTKHEINIKFHANGAEYDKAK